MTDGSLFDPATRARIRRDLATGTIIVFAIFTAVVGGLSGVLHRELPWLARLTGQCASGQYTYECDTLAYDALAGLRLSFRRRVIRRARRAAFPRGTRGAFASRRR